MPAWVKELQCDVHNVHYEYDHLTGFITMLAGNCCDMSGAIRYFERIDPRVRQIVSGYPERPEPDTCYRKVNGNWIALRSEEPRPVRDEI